MVARDVFDELGYDVREDGEAFRAVRGWKDVRVVPVADGTAVPAGDGALQCFVTWQERAAALVDAVRAGDRAGPWAVVAVSPDGDHEVVRAPAVGC